MAEKFQQTILPQPFASLIARMLKNSAFVQDMMLLSELPAELIDRISKSLSEMSFADQESTLHAIKLHTTWRNLEISEVVYYLAMLVRESGTRKQEVADEFRDIVSTNLQIQEEQVERLVVAFDKLCVEPQSLDMQHKAQVLFQAVGAKLVELYIVSDIRPVFDLQGETIKGALPSHFLHLEYENGELRKADIRLTFQELLKLKEIVDRAIVKHTSIKQAIEAVSHWDIPNV